MVKLWSKKASQGVTTGPVGGMCCVMSTKKEILNREAGFLRACLRETQGEPEHVAQALEITGRQLKSRLKLHAIEPRRFRPKPKRPKDPKKGRLHTALRELEVGHIRQALRTSHGRIGDAARMLNISRSSIYRKLEVYRIDPGKVGSGDLLRRKTSLRVQRHRIEEGLIKQALHETGGDVAAAAAWLGCDRSRLYRAFERAGRPE